MKNNSVNVIGLAGKIGSGKDTVGQMIQYLTSPCSQYGTPKYRTFSEYLERGGPGHHEFDTHYHSNWQVRKFAGVLKQVTATILGCHPKDFEDRDFKNKELGPEWRNDFSKIHDTNSLLAETYTPRTMLQYIGTDLFRKLIHPNVWVNATFANFKSCPIDEHGAYGHTYCGCNNNTDPYDHYGCEASQWLLTDMRFPNEAAAVKQRGGIVVRVTRPETDHLAGTHESETALDDYANWDVVIENTGTMNDLLKQVETKILAAIS